MLQVSTRTDFGGLFLHDDDIPGWFTCISNGSSVSFEVPLLEDSSLKGCLVRVVYSYSPKPTCHSAFPSVSVVNKTQRKSFIFDLIALSHHGTTCEGHLWQGLVSNDELKLKGGDKVEVSLDFGEYYTVKKTGLYLLFRSRVSYQMIQNDEPGTSSSWFHQKAQMLRGFFQI
uniref:Uncharacterized protein n=2 Tax=Ficus carica TaxID=3494 RepID=A0AA88E6K1_FICCA|nr:hypothetical protein TIFTF001_038082 [Ficus carica]